jgi:glutamyl-tRNA synthetase
MSAEVRVRFAPSPTGPLHIGGVRTALYNYLFAKKHHGTFILRIEDTDQLRLVPGAEAYITEALNWIGINPTESINHPGLYGPYRQSDRKELYIDHVGKLIASGHAYYAFDSPEELEQMREEETAQGNHSPKYDSMVRMKMKNSLTLSPDLVDILLKEDENVVVRMKIPQGEIISFEDEIRGRVQFASEELDDKVILKGDGLPTYHLANVVDDRLMKISHVIRGEEWLSSTAHHVLLYRFFGWEKEMPSFAHLPLIMKPEGKGKLSKRDGAKFGFPVFPLEWYDEKDKEVYTGFREAGFLPSALINFLSLLGWNPGTDEEMFTLEELSHVFSIEKINKSGAQFNYEKAKWFNQQYIMSTPTDALYNLVGPSIQSKTGAQFDQSYISTVIDMMKPRVETLDQFYSQAQYFWSAPGQYDEKTLKKKYKSENKEQFENIISAIDSQEKWTKEVVEHVVKTYINENGLKFGDILPLLRIWITGSMEGPDLFEMIILLGKQESINRLNKGLDFCKKM